MILDVREPKWNPDAREWFVDYVVADVVDNKNVKYIQRIRCEALVSAERVIKMIRERQR